MNPHQQALLTESGRTSAHAQSTPRSARGGPRGGQPGGGTDRSADATELTEQARAALPPPPALQTPPSQGARDEAGDEPCYLLLSKDGQDEAAAADGNRNRVGVRAALAYATARSGSGGHVSPRELPLSTGASTRRMRLSTADDAAHSPVVSALLGHRVQVRADLAAEQPCAAQYGELAAVSADQREACVRYDSGREEWVPASRVVKTLSLADLMRVADSAVAAAHLWQSTEQDIAEAVDAINDVGPAKGQPPSTVRETLWLLLEPSQAERVGDRAPRLRRLAWFISLTSQLVIVAAVLVVILDSLPRFTQGIRGHETDNRIFAAETVCVTFFALEFILRIVSCPDCKAFWKDGFTWIDFGSILPYFMTLAGATAGWQALQQFRMLRIIARTIRAARILKVGRHSVGIRLFALALRRSASPLAWYSLTLFVLIVVSSTMLFHSELDSCRWDLENRTWFRQPGYLDSAPRGQPAVKCQFQSIPDAMWWAIVTVTTVGYGDTHPVTELGKAVASVTMMMGVIVLAFPMVILTNSFRAVYECYMFAREGRSPEVALQDGVDPAMLAVQEEIQERFGNATFAAPVPRTASTPFGRSNPSDLYLERHLTSVREQGKNSSAGRCCKPQPGLPSPTSPPSDPTRLAT
eukprot:TRINITY_DN66481_c0_g1_i1.p1 TRINITY_DN66481_c0_g1~~TRINITY_DN66481_c0_g1_i1.p1  ORF type:complete len:640 (+),score=162.11 TRINITY_DN66481_c0_g1_i1:94-2013(+)